MEAFLSGRRRCRRAAASLSHRRILMRLRPKNGVIADIASDDTKLA